MKKTLIASAIALAGLATIAEAHPRSWQHGHGYHGGNQGSHQAPIQHTPSTYQARVVSVDPVYNSVPRKPRYKTVCHTEQVPIYKEKRVYRGNTYHSGHGNSGGNTDGALAGAIIGGILGNAIADDRRKGTVVGAIGGALVGSHVSDHQGNQRGGYSSGGYTTKRVLVGYRDKEICEQVQRPRKARQTIVGYDVAYRFRGHVYNTRLDYDPGRYVTVRVGN